MSRLIKVKVSLLEDLQTLIEGLYAQQAMTDWGGISSYNVLNAVIEESRADGTYDPSYGDDEICSNPECGHTYGRHYDPFDNDEHVGCKYCPCYDFQDSWIEREYG